MKNLNEKTHVFIVAGGYGSRSTNPARAKILQDVYSGKKLIEYHLENLVRENILNITLLLGYRSNEVIEEVENLRIHYPQVAINYSVENRPLGTFGSVVAAAKQITEDNLLIIFGDILINANYLNLIKTFIESNKRMGIIVHPNLHPLDSDLVISNEKGIITQLGKNEVKILGGIHPLRAVAGVFLVKRSLILDYALELGDFTKDFVQKLINAEPVLAMNSSDYFSDTGTPERLSKNQEMILKGGYRRRGGTKKVAIFLDRDGTLIENKGSARRVLESGEIDEQVGRAIQRLNDLGVIIFVVTNQPGIAKGQIDFLDVISIQRKIEDLLLNLGAFIDDYRFCPHHPDSGYEGERVELKIKCSCRKPSTKMVDELVVQHNISVSDSFYVGDTWRDEALAEAIKLNFYKIESQNRVQSLLTILHEIERKVSKL